MAFSVLSLGGQAKVLQILFCLLLVVGFVTGTTSVQAQSSICQGATLSSQADINYFSTTCPSFSGVLSIEGTTQGDDIVDLTPLKKVVFNRVDLYVQGTSQLESLRGLEVITEVGSWLGIYDNAALKNLDGLSGLTSLNATIEIGGNPVLETLQGIESQDGVIEALKIYDNPMLINLQGLEEITTLISVEIFDNEKLMSLKGLEGLTAIRNYLGIYDNSALASFCSLYPLFSEASLPSKIEIIGNASDPTQAEIVDGGPCLPDPTDYIGQLLDSGVINDGQLTALLAKLNKCNANALMNQIEAFVNAGIITREEADILAASTSASCP